MHTVHLPVDGAKNNIKYAAVGIMFDVNDYTAQVTDEQMQLIDDFFDELDWDETSKNPYVPLVEYGKMMMMFDTDNRWVYRGSVTTPPCDTNVYWNVMRDIYPIKQRHVDQFKKQLKRSGLETTGNNRLIQKIDDQDLHIVVAEKMKDHTGVVVLVVILAIIAFALCIVAIRLNFMLSAQSESEKGEEDTELANQSPSLKTGD